MKYGDLNPVALGASSAALASLCWLLMMGGYGMGLYGGSYGMMGYYPAMGAWMLVVFAALGYAAGWVFAKIYNYVNSR